jgi:hypothetical protein
MHLFVSYARTDAAFVLPIVDAVRDGLPARGLAISIWVDVEDLFPRQRWNRKSSAPSVRPSVCSCSSPRRP